tara:strand:- start:58 stop:675 length:618 start_codon:yes stop_codon:yes gene_type:complete
MKHLLISILFCSTFCYSQENITYKQANDIEFAKNYKNATDFNSYTSENGTTISVGDTLIIGKPSSDLKQYNQYTGNLSVFSNIIIGKMGMAAMTGLNYLPANSSGNKVIVEFIRVNHTKLKKKSPLYAYAFVKNPQVSNIAAGRTILNLEKALSLGEIISKNAPMTREQAIAKLKEAKDLYDLQIISESEYNELRKELTPIITNK